MKTSVKTKNKSRVADVDRSRQALQQLRGLRGILVNKGPKDVTAWQKKIRKDRKILN